MNSFGQRLLSARKTAGLTLQQLADKMDIEITKQALSLFEKGEINPTDRVLKSLSKALAQPVDYFFKETVISIGTIEFRQKKSLPQKEIESIKYKTAAYIEKYCKVENLLNLDSTFINPIKKTLVKNDKDIEKCTLEIRHAWSIGLAPITDVIKLLEIKRIKIYEIAAPDNFSGMSSWADGVAVIVINMNINLVRKRLTALHELGHLILTFPKGMDEKERERLCFSFASAFLLPKENFINEFGKKRTSILLDELIFLENYYGVSVQAIMWRALNLSIISVSKFNAYTQWLSKSGNKKNELGEYKGFEKPVRFKELVLKAISMGVITYNQAASLLGVTLSDLESEIF